MRDVYVYILGFLMGSFFFFSVFYHVHQAYILKSDLVHVSPTFWQTESFSCDDNIMTTAKGETHFYSAKMIDDWVDRINKLLVK